MAEEKFDLKKIIREYNREYFGEYYGKALDNGWIPTPIKEQFENSMEHIAESGYASIVIELGEKAYPTDKDKLLYLLENTNWYFNEADEYIP